MNGQPPDVSALQARVHELESLLQQQRSQGMTPQAPAVTSPQTVARSKAPPLFNVAAPATLTNADWNRLQQLAGTPPPSSGGGTQTQFGVATRGRAGQHLSADGKGGRGSGPSRTGLGSNRDGQGGFFAESHDGSAATKSVASGTTDCPQTSRPSARSFGWWKRKRQLIKFRRQRHVGAGGFHQGCSRSSESCDPMSTESPSRIGVRREQTGRIPYEALCGASGPSGGKPSTDVSGFHDVGSVGCWLGIGQHGASGLDLQDDDFYRTNLFGRGPNEFGLALDGTARSSIPFAGEQSSSTRTSTIQPSCKPVMGFRKSCIRERSRRVGVENADDGETRQEAAGPRRCRTGRSSSSKATSSTRKERTKDSGRSKPECKRSWSVRGGDHVGHTLDGCGNIDDCASALDSFATAAKSHNQPRDNCTNTAPLFLPDLSNPSRVFNPIQLVQGLVDQFWNCPSALTAFARSSLNSKPCTTYGKPSTSLWPVPPVRWRWTAASRLGPRRRRRRHFYRIRHELLQIALISLNWETLGFVPTPPKEAVLGAPISAQQHAIIERVEGMLDHFLHMSLFEADDLGRSSEKFQSVIKLIQSFPKCKLDVEVLEESFVHVQRYLDSYGHRPESGCSSTTVDDPAHLRCSDVGAVAKTSLASAKPVIADRVKWSYPPSFDAQEFLNPVVKEAYNDPEVLRKPEQEWPPSHPARMHIERKEFLKLVSKWDSLGACMLVDSTEVCTSRGARLARRPERAHAALWSPYGSTTAPQPRLPPPPHRRSASAKGRRSRRRLAFSVYLRTPAMIALSLTPKLSMDVWTL